MICYEGYVLNREGLFKQGASISSGARTEQERQAREGAVLFGWLHHQESTIKHC